MIKKFRGQALVEYAIILAIIAVAAIVAIQQAKRFFIMAKPLNTLVT